MMRRTRRSTWTFVESSEFQKDRETYLTDVEFRAVRELIPRYPQEWIPLNDGPGLFALHWGRRAPITIVFIVSPNAQKVYLIGIEPGRHDSVSREVKEALPALVKKLEKVGGRIAVWYGIRQLVKWIVENWPWADHI